MRTQGLKEDFTIVIKCQVVMLTDLEKPEVSQVRVGRRPNHLSACPLSFSGAQFLDLKE